MKHLMLSHRHFVSLNLYRRISTELWKSELDLPLRKRIEEYWSEKFQYDNIFDSKNLKDKYYVLSMFPYPSGNLHVGHVRVYTIADAIARYFRMTGKNVYQPMGWDAFGLPAENAALERGIAPNEWTEKNIEHMKSQLQKLLCSFDWNSELKTCSPEYYRWTQYIFLKMYETGIVFQKEALVNWDPIDETVLAEEQVDEEGHSWRSGAKVEKKLLKQWFIRTTKFAKDLRAGLDKEELNSWLDVVDLQKNWIGDCDGYSFDFRIVGMNRNNDYNFLNIWVQDCSSVLDAEFIVVQPDSVVDIISENSRDSHGKLPLEVMNPFTNSNLPIYVNCDVPYPFGRNVYVGVPSRSQFDREFAQKVGLKARTRVAVCNADQICETAKKLNIGGYLVSSRLQDWLISRQRYWGTPIPVVHCDKCGTHPVPYEQLPVALPPLPKEYKVGKSLNTFLESSAWRKTECPKCAGEALREVDTMDTFFDSSWYYLRYFDVNNHEAPFDRNRNDQMMPVDLYVGGKEHAVLHLYYARFVHYFLHSIGMVKYPEPFTKLLCQGIVKGKTYRTKDGRYLKPEEIKIEGKKATLQNTGEKLKITWEKMSKSKYNGVDPEDVIDKYGVDTTRLFILFRVSPFLHREWNESLFDVALKYQHRMWLTIREFLTVRSNPLKGPQPEIVMFNEEMDLRRERNQCVSHVTHHFQDTHQLAEALEHLFFLLQKLRRTVREVRKYSKEYEMTLGQFIIMLAPIMPHFAATLWFGFTSAPGRLITECEEIDWNANVLQQNWPVVAEDANVDLVYRVNMGPHYQLQIPVHKLKTLTLEEAMTHARQHKNVSELITKYPVIDVRMKKYAGHKACIYITTERPSALQSEKQDV